MCTIMSIEGIHFPPQISVSVYLVVHSIKQSWNIEPQIHVSGCHSDKSPQQQL